VKGRPREGMSFPRMPRYQAYSSKDRAFTDDHGSQDPVHPLQGDTLLENRTTLLGTIMPETRKISLEIHEHVTTAVARITSSEIVTRRKTWYRILAAWSDRTKQILYELCLQAEDAIFDNTDDAFEAFFAEPNESDADDKTCDETPQNFHSQLSQVMEDPESRSQGLSEVMDPSDF